MTWWQTMLATSLPILLASGVGLLTWRSLHRQQTASAAHDFAQAIGLDITNLEELRSQVDCLWTERNQFRDKLAAALTELCAARAEAVRLAAELALARDDLHTATGDIATLRRELDRARERIVLLEREVVRLGGNPDVLDGHPRKGF